MKKFTFVLLLVAVSCCCFALSVSYDFNIDGKTNVDALRDKIEVPATEEFETVEQALAAAENYKNKINNLRLYTSCDYSYELSEDLNSMVVTYNVKDAKTLLILPYPKYDSNSGLSLKVKAVEKNFSGNFGEFNAAVGYSRENSDNIGTIDLNASDIKLGNGSYSGHFDTNINFNSLGSSELNLNVASLYEVKEFEFTPYIEVNDLRFDTFSAKSYVFGLSATRRKITASESLAYYPDETENKIVNTLGLDYQLKDTLSLGTALSISKNYFEISANAKHSKTINGVLHEFTISDSEAMSPSTKLSTNYAGASVHVESSNINYVQKDFRLGMDYSISADVRQLFKNELDGFSNYYRARAELTWFPFASKSFNPSFRIIGSVSSIPYYSFNESEGFGINYLDDSAVLSGYMRGVRDNNSDSYTISSAKAFLLINMNLTAKFLSIGNFADTYATGFCDIAVMYGESGIKNMLTVGCEGICILRQYPSYPIRASLGVNLDSFCNWYGSTRDEKPEYELYIGLYHFF